MNKRQLKKAMKKKGAEALIGRNAYLERENVKLRRALTDTREGVNEIKENFNKNMATLVRFYGEKIEGYRFAKIPVEEFERTISDYNVLCSIENGQYIICVLPKVDPEAI